MLIVYAISSKKMSKNCILESIWLVSYTVFYMNNILILFILKDMSGKNLQ